MATRAEFKKIISPLVEHLDEYINQEPPEEVEATEDVVTEDKSGKSA